MDQDNVYVENLRFSTQVFTTLTNEKENLWDTLTSPRELLFWSVVNISLIAFIFYLIP